MRNLLRIAKHVGLVALLALSATGVALTGDSAAVASASTITRESYICYSCPSSSPTISAQYTNQFSWTEGYITGNYFTPGGTVRVYTYSPSGVYLSQVTTTATSTTSCNLSGLCTAPGAITVYNFGYPACQSSYNVRAYDASTGKWSNTATVYWINCLT
jgi:hypothetical protein